MADRPILFNPPMVRALLDGRKTQTRRILSCVEPLDDLPSEMQEDLELRGWSVFDTPHGDVMAKPAHAEGDCLWVREAWRADVAYDRLRPSDLSHRAALFYEADSARIGDGCPGKLRPSLFMPRWASRRTLIVTDVRVQRLQDISEEDARAEGADDIGPCDHHRATCAEIGCCGPGYRGGFHEIWNALDGSDAWAANPWVSATSFRPVLCNIDSNQKGETHG